MEAANEDGEYQQNLEFLALLLLSLPEIGGAPVMEDNGNPCIQELGIA